jgi:hypothetical protein
MYAMAFLSTDKLSELINIMEPIDPDGEVYRPMSPAYIEFTRKRIARERRLKEYEASLSARDSAHPKRTAFLSYSHHDKKWAHGLSLYFKMIEADLYVDLRDDSLPRDVGGKTARALRDRIAKRDKFILLATDKTKDSAWVPWELGLADGLRGHKNVVIFPLSTVTDFAGQEYFDDYSHVEESAMKSLTVVDPKNGTRQEFSHWLYDVSWSVFPDKWPRLKAWWKRVHAK